MTQSVYIYVIGLPVQDSKDIVHNLFAQEPELQPTRCCLGQGCWWDTDEPLRRGNNFELPLLFVKLL